MYFFIHVDEIRYKYLLFLCGEQNIFEFCFLCTRCKKLIVSMSYSNREREDLLIQDMSSLWNNQATKCLSCHFR